MFEEGWETAHCSRPIYSRCAARVGSTLIPWANLQACETKAAPHALVMVRLQWIHCKETTKPSSRGCRIQANVLLWRHRQRVNRRNLHARRGVRPSGHETETNTHTARPARSATSRSAHHVEMSSQRVQDPWCYNNDLLWTERIPIWL